MVYPRCATCIHRKIVWRNLAISQITVEMCVNPKLGERGETYGDDTLEYSYNEGGGFFVGPNFGCVHHEAVKEKDRE